MGTGVEVRLAPEDDSLLGYAEQRTRDLEYRWSRFIESSELSRLNRSEGRPTIVSPETFRLVTVAVEAYSRTGGLFDPRVLPAIEDAGYVVSHQTLIADPSPIARASTTPPARRTTQELSADLDEALCAVTLPPADRWDPGGIGKGLACDLLVEELAALGAESIMVNLGGDLRVHGEAIGEPCWTVQVGDPLHDDAPFADVHLSEGAVATSSRARRRWLHNGESKHHLIDPRSGDPAETDLVSVTVVASCTWWAEVLAKAALIAGPEGGRALVEQAGCSALFIDVHGAAVTLGGHIRVKEIA